MNDSQCEIYLIRHGLTDWNELGILQGQLDIPLNDTGRVQAEELYTKIKDVPFAAAYASDLSRASETASIVLKDRELDIITTPMLREMYLGNWQGLKSAALVEWLTANNISTLGYPRDEYLDFKIDPDCESYSNIFERTLNFIRDVAIKHLGSSILVSAHGGVLSSFLYYFDFKPELRWKVPNCAYIKLRIGADLEIEIIERLGIVTTEDPSIP